MNKELLSKNDVCNILRISIGSLDRMMKRKEINYIKFSRNVRFEVEEIDRLLNELKVVK